jgi:hypothetical protein
MMEKAAANEHVMNLKANAKKPPKKNSPEN